MNVSAENQNTEGNNSLVVATQTQKVRLVVLLILATTLFVFLWLLCIRAVDEKFHKETRVSWCEASEVVLAPGPPNFFVDHVQKEIVFIGIIDKTTKSELLNLCDENAKEFVNSYREAVEKISFESNRYLNNYFYLVLTLGGASGVIGVSLRSLINLVGNACYKNRLDVIRWWPWYVVRPVYGFILGVLIVILVRAGAISTGNIISLDTFGWVALASLAGFGADEFTQRLRSLTQTLFGHADGSKENK